MKTGLITTSLCLLCLSLAMVSTARSQTPSVLDRVQNVDDPELAELIRVALESRTNLGQKQTLEITRQVTLSYLQIKLLDRQIAEVSRKIRAETGPEEMRYELLLAKTELESKLMTELANLREIMGIIPRHPFEAQPIETLNTWLHLHVLDQGVNVLDSLKPYAECWTWWGYWRIKSLGFLSEREALDVVRERLQNKANLPIRIDIHHAPETRSSAQDLYRKIVSLIKEANRQMEAEVNLEPIHSNMGPGVSTFYVREGTISTFYCGAAAKQRPDGSRKPIITGVVEPNDLDQNILWRLTHPGLIPLKCWIEYDHDPASARLAKHIADRVGAIARDLGISRLVEVEKTLVESVPENAFFGHWQVATRGEVQTIDIQPNGACVFVKSPGSKIPGGTSVPGRWFLIPKEVYMDIKDYRESHYIYLGHIDEQGNLVVRRGNIDRQGGFHGGGSENTMIFKKVY